MRATTLVFLLGLSLLARALDLCPTKLSKTSCLIECETYWKQNPEARPESKRGICETPAEVLWRRLNPEQNAALAKACAKGAWEGILSFTETLKAYAQAAGDYAEFVVKSVRESNAELLRCNADRECRRATARLILAYGEKKSDGSWKIPDAELDQMIQGRHIVELLHIANQNRNDLRRLCQDRLAQINGELMANGDARSYERQLARWERLRGWNEQCPVVMGFSRPEPPVMPEEKVRGSWLASLGIKLQCYPPEKIQELVCYEIASLVADPLSVAGTGALA
ncbi:MAG: hypothetical protein N2578_08820, partial [Bdellovibrionaceae bacterium]|nr:hypothetical protein [Pseudobdellovibrionaceae bacterium]